MTPVTVVRPIHSVAKCVDTVSISCVDFSCYQIVLFTSFGL